MENRNRTTAVAEPTIPKDEFELVRRPAFDEVPDAVEMAALREASRRIRLGRSMLADSLMPRH
ncbi:MAG: hypothetical protein K8R92_10875 [Planctomycetes bacterium]|nr:hypothetical protein [Planctomycetota bacterium]